MSARPRTSTSASAADPLLNYRDLKGPSSGPFFLTCLGRFVPKSIPPSETSLTLHFAVLHPRVGGAPEASQEGRAVRGRLVFRTSQTQLTPTLRPTGAESLRSRPTS